VSHAASIKDFYLAGVNPSTVSLTPLSHQSYRRSVSNSSPKVTSHFINGGQEHECLKENLHQDRSSWRC
jgi:hypothetical protein